MVVKQLDAQHTAGELLGAVDATSVGVCVRAEGWVGALKMLSRCGVQEMGCRDGSKLLSTQRLPWR